MGKIDFKDTTFIIPVYIDCRERLQNLWVVLYYLTHNFDTNIFVYEQNNNLSEDTCNSFPNVIFDKVMVNNTLMHRTKLLNLMLKQTKTPFVSNYDCDVLFPIEQYLTTINILREGAFAFVLPFNQPTIDIKREYIAEILKTNDLLSLPDKAKFINVPHLVAHGGAVFAKTDTYKEIGGENETFISYGPEDKERYNRIIKLNHKLFRVEGNIFHLLHQRGINSSINHNYYSNNNIEFEKIIRLSKQELLQEIQGWEWYDKIL